MSERDGSPPAHGWWVLAILSLLMGFASISTDLYLPAMPTMGVALGASPGLIEWTVSGYLLGFSSGQLIWGPVSDRHGRRLPIAIGLVFFVVGSAGCALSTTTTLLIACRLFQAFGASAGVVLSRAMVRDLYSGHRAAQMLSTLITIMAIAPLLGPLVGGQILLLAGWRAIFWTLVVIGILTLAALTTVPETLAPHRRNPEHLARAMLRYGELLTHRRLLGYAGTGGLFYGGMFAYIAGTPFAYITYHHLLPQHYGMVFALGIVGIMGSNQLNGRLVARYGSDRLMRFGAAMAMVSGLAVAAVTVTDTGGLAGLVVPLMVFASSTGFIVANSIVGAMADFPERAGMISALVGAVQYGCGIFGSGIVGACADGTPRPMGCVIAVTAIISFVCAFFVVPRHQAAE